ncbi:MAG: hypothetical protein HQK96_05625 [Nitrospirae bacterium]|nr:hypothetical protein [Nitrospirota bacterium]
MIVSDGGRNKTVRTPEEVEEILRADLSRMTDKERECVVQILKDFEKDGKSLALEVGQKEQYEEIPVSMKQWMEDDYYFGNPCEGLWPGVREDLLEIFTGDYNEAIISGAIGVGKSTLAEIATCRQIYEMACLRNPQRTYGLRSGSTIALVNFSVSEKLAEKVVFDAISENLKMSPWFSKFFNPERTKSELRFPKNIWVTCSSSSPHSSLGLSVIGATLDETNFMGMVSRDQRAAQTKWEFIDNAQILYSSIRRRIKSRFEQFGRLPGMVLLVSSKRMVTDFTERRILESKNEKHVFVSERALWEAKPERYYSADTFKVVVGNENLSSRIVQSEEDIVEANEKEARVVNVPIDFKSDFEKDLEGCFTGDTKISLLDGTEVCIRDLVGRESFWVYSFTEDRRLRCGMGHSARLTKKNEDIVKITLDNGEIIKCTPTHMIMLKSGEYKEARVLTLTDSLMSLYRKNDKYGYEMFKSNVGGKWCHTHNIISREYYLNGERRNESDVVHHIDFNKRNNSPLNLKIMDIGDYIAFHSSKKLLEKGMHSISSRKKAVITRRNQWKNTELKEWQIKHLKRSSDQFKKYNVSEKHRAVASRVGKMFGFGAKKLTEKQIESKKKNADFIRNYVKIHNLTDNPVMNLDVRKKISESRNKKVIGCSFCDNSNHKIVSIEKFGKEDVYDITVDKYSNFALSSGVVVHNSIRDIAGLSTVSVYPFIRKREKIENAIDNAMVHPVETDVWAFSEPLRMKWDKLVSKKDGISRPIVDPEAARHIHIDPSLSGDTTGFVMGHIQRYVPVKRKDALNDETVEMAPLIVIDFMLKIIPPPGGEIIIGDLRSLVYNLHEKGFKIGFVSMDSYIKADPIQILNSKGFKADHVSVDSSVLPYQTLKDAFYEDRIIMYRYEPVLVELKGLEFNLAKRKVDHPIDGEKDVADSLAAVVYTLTNKSYAEMPISIFGRRLDEDLVKGQIGDAVKAMNRPDKKIDALDFLLSDDEDTRDLALTNRQIDVVLLCHRVKT